MQQKTGRGGDHGDYLWVRDDSTVGRQVVVKIGGHVELGCVERYGRRRETHPQPR